jgi:transcriptional regulator with XRE-family HTH domain
MKNINISTLENIQCLESELEYEKALAVFKKLRWMLKDDPTLKPKRQHLKELILQFEKDNWNSDDNISDQQLAESDVAVKLIEKEEEFIYQRKEIIKKRLKKIGLNQQELGKILGHRKNYTSELINGVRPFSKNDLVIIHRLLNIKLDKLMPTFIESEMIANINKVLEELNIEKLNLDEKTLALSK